MIKITITKSGRDIYTVNENTVTKETPTQYTQDEDYGNKKKVVMAREFAVTPVEKVREWTQTLLEQQIADDSEFDLGAVIKAINGL